MYTTLQAGRAIAAIGVLLSHMTVLMALQKYGGNVVADLWFKAGTFGVDYFFVLSGFIIYTAHKKDIGQADRLKPYLLKRFTRVYPLYWLYTAGFATLVLLGVGDKAFDTGPLDWLSHLTLIHWTAAEAPLSVAWTLFFEIQFYALFGLAIINKRAAAIGLLIWLTAILALGSSSYGGLGKGTFLVELTSWYNMNFLVGVAAAFALERLRGAYARSAILVGLLCVAGFIVAWHEGFYEAQPRVRLIGAMGFALLVYGGVAFESATGRRAPKPLTFLGDASYTIYLAHLPLASLYMMVVTRLGVIERIGVAATFILGCVIVTAICGVLYVVIEKWIIKQSRVLTTKTSNRSAPLATA